MSSEGSKGLVIEPDSVQEAADIVRCGQILDDLRGVWELANNRVFGDIVWATDEGLETSVGPNPTDRLLGRVPNAVKYLSPGNLKYPKDFPVPGFATHVDIYAGDVRPFVPMLVFKNPIEIDKTPVQFHRINSVRGKDGESPTQKVRSVDDLLKALKAPEAFVVEVGAFMPWAGEGKSYETHFVPGAYSFDSDHMYTLVVNNTVINASHLVKMDTARYLEDASNPEHPRLFDAVRAPLVSVPSSDEAPSQMIIVAQSGHLPGLEDLYRELARERERFEGLESLSYGGPTKGGYAVGRARIGQGRETSTRYSNGDFQLYDNPAVVYNLHVFGLTKADVPSTNPQLFSQFVSSFMQRHREAL